MSEIESIAEVLDDSELGNLEKKTSWGGARPGGGRPKGKLSHKTLEAMKVKEAVNQRIMVWADRLLNAQLDLATGEKVLMVKRTDRDSKGKVIRVYHEVVSDKETIIQYLDWEEGEGEDVNDDQNYYYMTTKPANNQALDSLINRALGKVPDKLEVAGDGLFDNPKLIIEVVGAKHAGDTVIGEDGLLHPADGSDSGDGTEQTPAERETTDSV